MKIEEQVLSIEQMKHLQELGVDTSDASMCWVAGEDTSTDEGEWYLTIPNNFLLPYNIPTYTIGDLLEKLPKSDNSGDLLIEYRNSELGYGVWDWGELYGINAQQNFKDKPLKNALYDLLCWVAENHKELLEVRNE